MAYLSGIYILNPDLLFTLTTIGTTTTPLKFFLQVYEGKDLVTDYTDSYTGITYSRTESADGSDSKKIFYIQNGKDKTAYKNGNWNTDGSENDTVNDNEKGFERSEQKIYTLYIPGATINDERLINALTLTKVVMPQLYVAEVEYDNIGELSIPTTQKIKEENGTSTFVKAAYYYPDYFVQKFKLTQAEAGQLPKDVTVYSQDANGRGDTVTGTLEVITDEINATVAAGASYPLEAGIYTKGGIIRGPSTGVKVYYIDSDGNQSTTSQGILRIE